MPPAIAKHKEKHFTGSETMRDIVIGMSDGLTVPFALAAGLTGAIVANDTIVTAGVAEMAAGGISMGLGGYLAARSQAEHYDSERRREEREIVKLPEAEAAEVVDILMEYGLTREEATPVVESLRQRPKDWVDFMMRFELGLERPDPSRAWKSGLTVGGSYVIGAIIPLSAYMVLDSSLQALWVSIGVTLAALFVLGGIKGRFTGVPPFKSAFQTMMIGAIAAAAAFGIARLVG